MNSRFALTLVVLIAVSVVAFGCGGDDSDSSASAAPLTKAQFVKQANAICERGRQKAVATQATSQAAAVSQGIVPAIRSSIDEVSALSVPEGDEEQVEAIFESLRRALDQATEQKVASVTQLEALLKKPGAEARQYGISSCAYG